MTKYLVPIKGTERCYFALDTALNMLKPEDILFILHIIAYKKEDMSYDCRQDIIESKVSTIILTNKNVRFFKINASNQGERFKGINQFVKENNIDLCVIGIAHGKLKGLGSTSNQLVKQPMCDFIVLKTKKPNSIGPNANYLIAFKSAKKDIMTVEECVKQFPAENITLINICAVEDEREMNVTMARKEMKDAVDKQGLKECISKNVCKKFSVYLKEQAEENDQDCLCITKDAVTKNQIGKVSLELMENATGLNFFIGRKY